MSHRPKLQASASTGNIPAPISTGPFHHAIWMMFFVLLIDEMISVIGLESVMVHERMRAKSIIKTPHQPGA